MSSRPCTRVHATIQFNELHVQSQTLTDSAIFGGGGGGGNRRLHLHKKAGTLLTDQNAYCMKVKDVDYSPSKGFFGSPELEWNEIKGETEVMWMGDDSQYHVSGLVTFKSRNGQDNKANLEE